MNPTQEFITCFCNIMWANPFPYQKVFFKNWMDVFFEIKYAFKEYTQRYILITYLSYLNLMGYRFN